MENTYKIVNLFTRSGITKNGVPYTIDEANIDFMGKTAKIRIPKGMTACVGDNVCIGLGTKRAFGCNELTAVITEVIPAAQKGEHK